MAIDRAIDPSTYTSGTDLATDLADTQGYLAGLNLGVLKSVAGTNTITAEIEKSTGFTAPAHGSRATLVPANNNTDAVTLAIKQGDGTSGTAIAVKTNKGDALSKDDLVASKAYPIEYDSANTCWRVLTDVPSQAEQLTIDDVPPYTRIKEFTADGTFTAPYKCYVRIWLFGGYGAGSLSGIAKAGGGPGVSIKDRFLLTPGQQLTFDIAAGGTSAADGNDSTCTGPNSLSMTAEGGTKATTSANGVGGDASGGDANLTGENGDGSTVGANGLIGDLGTYAVTIGPFTKTSLASPTNSGSNTAGFAVVEYTTEIA